MAEDREQKKFRLEDMRILTVGLVKRGANQENFFLLKSKTEDNNMSDETTNVEDQEVETVDFEEILEENPGLGQKFLKFLQEKFSSEEEETEEVEAVDEEVEEPELEKADEPQTDPEPEPAPTVEIPEFVTDQLAALQKSNEAMRDELQKYQKQAEEERENRERQEYLEKAEAMSNLPEQPAKVADILHTLAKHDKGMGEALETLLKAVDAQIAEAGFYGEYGTNLVPEETDAMKEAQERVQKGEAPTLVDAYLKSVSPEEGQKHILEHRKKIRRSG